MTETELLEVVRAAKEQAWDEGFEAAEEDHTIHKLYGFEHPCVPNPHTSPISGLTVVFEYENKLGHKRQLVIPEYGVASIGEDETKA